MTYWKAEFIILYQVLLLTFTACKNGLTNENIWKLNRIGWNLL